MSEVSMKQHFAVPASQIWQLVGNFQAIPDWHPWVTKSQPEEGGSVRKMTMPDGSVIEEKLQHHDENARTYSYVMTKGEVPFSGYSATIKIIEDEDGKGCTVEWSSAFEAQGDSNAAVQGVQKLYEAGFENLQKMFGGK